MPNEGKGGFFKNLGKRFQEITGFGPNPNKGGILGKEIMDLANTHGIRWQAADDTKKILADPEWSKENSDNSPIFKVVSSILDETGILPLDKQPLAGVFTGKVMGFTDPSHLIKGKKALSADFFASQQSKNSPKFTKVLHGDHAFAEKLEPKDFQNELFKSLGYKFTPRTSTSEEVLDTLVDHLTNGSNIPTSFTTLLKNHLRYKYDDPSINDIVVKNLVGVGGNLNKFKSILDSKEKGLTNLLTPEFVSSIKGKDKETVKKLITDRLQNLEANYKLETYATPGDLKLFDSKFTVSEAIKPDHEVRVHALKGKVVPSASVEKYINPTIRGALDSINGQKSELSHDVATAYWQKLGLPLTNNSQRIAETTVNDWLRHLEKTNPSAFNQIESQALGFDVGINKGKGIIYELNPSGKPDSYHPKTPKEEAKFGSGYYPNPLVGRAHIDAIRGKLPLDMLLRRTATIGAGTGLAAVGVHEALKPVPNVFFEGYNNLSKSDINRMLWAGGGLAGLAGVGALHADASKKNKKRKEDIFKLKTLQEQEEAKRLVQ